MELSKNFMTPQSKKYKIEDEQQNAAIKQQIDELLKHQFELLRQANADNHAKRFSTHNSLFLEYIRAVYGEYNISDPLGEINLSQLSSEPSAIKTIKKQKIHLMSNHTLRYSASPRNISSIISETPLNITQLDNLRSNHSKEDLIKHISYHHSLDKIGMNQSLDDLLDKLKIQEPNSPTGQKEIRGGLEMIIQQELKINMCEDNQDITIPTFAISNQHHPKQGNNESNNPEIAQQAFRYCVGCERPIIEGNLRHHEESCQHFQAILSMPDEEAVKCLTEKVDRMKQKLNMCTQQIRYNEVEQFKQSSLHLTEEAKIAVQNGVVSGSFENEYFKVIQIGKKWCLISEEANKIHWFLKIIYQQKSLTA